MDNKQEVECPNCGCTFGPEEKQELEDLQAKREHLRNVMKGDES